jgi:dihydrodipicolinate synthase/N-acetylneuraminate lyase
MDLAHRYYTALVLPFDSGGRVDEGAYRDPVQYFLQERFRSVGGLIANPEAARFTT